MGKRAIVAVGIAGALLVLAGCAGFADPRPPAESVDGVVCVSELGDRPPLPDAGLLPEDFEAVAVHRCNGFAERDGATGALVERLEGDLEPFLSAMRAPSDPRWPGPCSAIGWAGPSFWVTDAAGRAALLSYPSDGCGMPKAEEALEAAEELSVVDAVFVPDAG